MFKCKERYIIIVDTEAVKPPFGRKLEIRYLTDSELDRFLEDPNGALPDGYIEDEDGDLWVSIVVHNEGIRLEPHNDRKTFETAENLIYMTGTHLFRGEYEGIMEILGASRKAVAHVVDMKARRVMR